MNVTNQKHLQELRPFHVTYAARPAAVGKAEETDCCTRGRCADVVWGIQILTVTQGAGWGSPRSREARGLHHRDSPSLACMY